jgi:hypothetical protein
MAARSSSATLASSWSRARARLAPCTARAAHARPGKRVSSTRVSKRRRRGREVAEQDGHHQQPGAQPAAHHDLELEQVVLQHPVGERERKRGREHHVGRHRDREGPPGEPGDHDQHRSRGRDDRPHRDDARALALEGVARAERRVGDVGGEQQEAHQQERQLHRAERRHRGGRAREGERVEPGERRVPAVDRGERLAREARERPAAAREREREVEDRAVGDELRQVAPGHEAVDREVVVGEEAVVENEAEGEQEEDPRRREVRADQDGHRSHGQEQETPEEEREHEAAEVGGGEAVRLDPHRVARAIRPLEPVLERGAGPCGRRRGPDRGGARDGPALDAHDAVEHPERTGPIGPPARREERRAEDPVLEHHEARQGAPDPHLHVEGRAPADAEGADEHRQRQGTHPVPTSRRHRAPRIP